MKRLLLALTAAVLLAGCTPQDPFTPQVGDTWGWTLHQDGPDGPRDVVLLVNTILAVSGDTVTYSNRNGLVTDQREDFQVSARLLSRSARR